jgi:hypothetical protein
MTFNIGVVNVVAFGLNINSFEATMFNLGMFNISVLEWSLCKNCIQI